MLVSAGWWPVKVIYDAKVIIINTCAFIQSAVKESIEIIKKFSRIKNENQILVVVGCLVGRYGKDLSEELGKIDILITPEGLFDIVDILNKINKSTETFLVNKERKYLFGSQHPRVVSTDSGWAYLKISEGCNNKCNYCTIPSIRGSLHSRSIKNLKKEATTLVKMGVKELNLIAQDLTAYGLDRGNVLGLQELLVELDSLEGLRWIRLLYLNPNYNFNKLFDILSKTSKILPYFDLPIQHVSEPVLKAMNRYNHIFSVKKLINRIRTEIPKAIIRATLMVGHPGEGKQEFEELLEFTRKTRFEHLGCFIYEPEQGTKSAEMDRPICKDGKNRFEKIMKLQKNICKSNLDKMVGKKLDCLILGPRTETDLLWSGRLEFQAPEVDGNVFITSGNIKLGEIVKCKITKAHNYDLEAVLI